MSPQTFTTGAVFGSLLLAIWVFLCLPRLRPSTLKVAVIHVVASFAVFHLAPLLVELSGDTAPSPYASVVFDVVFVVLPGLVYIYVSWIWLLGLIAKHLSGRSGGGHLVRSGA